MKKQNFTENQVDFTKTHGEFINEGISPSTAETKSPYTNHLGMTLYHPSTRGILNFTIPSLWSLLSSQHLVIVYGIHFSTVAYFWAKWVVQRMFMRFEQHTIFLTPDLSEDPFRPVWVFPTPVENEPGARDASQWQNHQAGCDRNHGQIIAKLPTSGGSNPHVWIWNGGLHSILYHFIAFQLNVGSGSWILGCYTTCSWRACWFLRRAGPKLINFGWFILKITIFNG